VTTPDDQNVTDVAADETAVEAVAEVAADDYVSVEEPAVAEEIEVAAAVAAPAPIHIDRPIQTVGRRKEAVARVRMTPGSGQFKLNGRTIEDYFPNKVHQQLIKAPLVAVERAESFDIVVLLHGGGPSGQAGALRLAIARALIEVTPDDRPCSSAPVT